MSSWKFSFKVCEKTNLRYVEFKNGMGVYLCERDGDLHNYLTAMDFDKYNDGGLVQYTAVEKTGKRKPLKHHPYGKPFSIKMRMLRTEGDEISSIRHKTKFKSRKRR